MVWVEGWILDGMGVLEYWFVWIGCGLYVGDSVVVFVLCWVGRCWFLESSDDGIYLWFWWSLNGWYCNLCGRWMLDYFYVWKGSSWMECSNWFCWIVCGYWIVDVLGRVWSLWYFDSIVC